MALSRQNALIVVMFLAPVVCCFVGIGAFVHVILAADQAKQQKRVELRKQKLKELAGLQQELDDLKKTFEGLLEKIREVENKIRELTDKLLRANQDSETARKIEEEIRGQKKLLAKLLAELSGLDDQIAQKEKELEALRTQIKKAGPLNDQQKKLEKQMEELQKRVEQASKEHNRLLAKADDLRRQREEEGRKTPIIPRKPLPPGTSKPVFVECTATGATIQPEGIRLNAYPQAKDRSRFLAAARKSGFVVFLVRPNGVGSFRKYRALTQNNGAIKFGFEPVDASWNLVYPK